MPLLAGVGGSADTPSGQVDEANVISLSTRIPAKVAHSRRVSGPATGIQRQMTANEVPPTQNVTAQNFKAVVMPYLDDAYTLARYLTRNTQDADDVVQDAYLRAFKFFATFKGDNPRAWLLAIVRNCFFTWIKAKPRGREESLSEVDLDTFDKADSDVWTSGPVDPETAMVRIDDAETVRKLIEGLPMPFREVLVLRELDDLSYREIADITGVPTGTVMSRLARARAMFKAAWMDCQAKGQKA
jgi:RNA polymerase sigma-70 factor (ECF subfamily)